MTKIYKTKVVQLESRVLSKSIPSEFRVLQDFYIVQRIENCAADCMKLYIFL